MESLEGLCFTHLCSYLFFNELLVLRLVSISVKRQLEGEEFALNVRQTRALIFPSHWGDSLPGYHSIYLLSSRLTNCAPKLNWSASRDSEIPLSQSSLSADNTLSVSQSYKTVASAHDRQSQVKDTSSCKILGEEESNRGKNCNPKTFFRRFLSAPLLHEGLRELCLCWQNDDHPRRLSSALRELLKACAPFLESLTCSGSCLTVWRYSFPLKLNFSALSRLLIISGVRESNLSLKRYREQLTWHVLGRCQFPVCREFRWMDFSSECLLETLYTHTEDDEGETEVQEEEDAEEQGFQWHEIILQQVDLLTTLLSSMKCLREFTFTADARYSIVQVLLYLASQHEKCNITTVEIVPAYPNARTLERDWLLSPADIFDGELPAILSSVTRLRLVLRDCKLEQIVAAEIFPVLQRLCPCATICVSGSVRTSLELADETVRVSLPEEKPPEQGHAPLLLDHHQTSAALESEPRHSFLNAPTTVHDCLECANVSEEDESSFDENTVTSRSLVRSNQVFAKASVWLHQTFCTAPLEILFLISERKTGRGLGSPCASVKFLRTTCIRSDDETAWLCMSQTIKKLLHLKSNVLPSVRLRRTAVTCTRKTADKINELISCFPHIMLSVEGYGAEPDCFIHTKSSSSRLSSSSPNFSHPLPSTAPSALVHSLPSSPFPTTLHSLSRASPEVVGLQIYLMNGFLTSDLSVLLTILSRHPDVVFLRFVDTWSAADGKRTTPCEKSQMFHGMEFNVLLRHNKGQIILFEYSRVGPVCWQRQAGIPTCGPAVPEAVEKDFFLHNKVAFLAFGAFGSDENDAVHHVFSSLYVRGKLPQVNQGVAVSVL